MAAPLIVPLILLGGATIALAAASAKKKKAVESSDASGTGKTYTLDLDMPTQLRNQVLAALATEKDATKLESFASAIAPTYPLAAAALRTKEAMQEPVQQAVPQAQPRQSAAAQVAAPIPPPPVVQTAPPTTNVVPQVPIFPVSPPTPSVPIPMPPAPSPPMPVASSASPLPASYLGGLDPGMPNEMQKAIVGALTTETDPAKLEGFASAIQSQYPVAGGLLMAKSQALRLAHSSGQPTATTPVAAPAAPAIVSPAASSPIAPATAAAASVAPGSTAPALSTPAPPVLPANPPVLPSAGTQVPAAYPIGDASSRAGKNAARLTGYPFILIRPTDSTWPAKIAEQVTGHQMDYVKFINPINPHLAPGGKWRNIFAGDTLNIPWEWAAKLKGLYLIEVDPGATPPGVTTSGVPSSEIVHDVGANARGRAAQRGPGRRAASHGRAPARALPPRALPQLSMPADEVPSDDAVDQPDDVPTDEGDDASNA